MGKILKVDEHEPTEVELLIKQVVPDTVRTSLNRAGYADYMWTDFDSQPEHIERKQCAEILGGMNKIEDQLKRELEVCETLTLLVEGVAMPDETGTMTYKLRPNGQGFQKGRKFGLPFAAYEGFLMGLERAGIRVWKTISHIDTAQYVSARFKQAQKTEHSTLSRHLAPEVSYFRVNPQVRALLGLCGGLDARSGSNERIGIGPKSAEALIEVFGNVQTILDTPPTMIAGLVGGVGKLTIERLHKKIRGK